MARILRIAAVFLVAGLLSSAALAADDTDAGAVRHLLMVTFDRPDAPLIVDPVTTSGDIAIAGWAQGDGGGRALLRKKHGTWAIVLCSGDALKDAAALQTFGLAADQAASLAAAVVEAEGRLDPARVAKFSTFDGVMMIDEGGHHPPADGHGKSGHNG